MGEFNETYVSGRDFESEVLESSDKFVVEQPNEPTTIEAPISGYEQCKQERANFFDKLREIQDRINLTSEEADRLANEAVKAVRNS